MSDRSHRPRGRALAAALTAGLLAVALSAAAGASARGGGGPSAPAPAAAPLPVDFPADISLPPGTLQGATGAAGQWSVLILARGSAADTLRSTERFYEVAGFGHDGNATMRRGSERIVIVAENRDHSATATNLTLGVTDLRSAADGAGPIAVIDPGSRVVSLQRARRSGLSVRFIAPPSARRATVREYATSGGSRRLIGSRRVPTRGGSTTVTLGGARVRRRARPGTYLLEVVLRDGAGTQGPAASMRVRVTG